MRIAVACAGLEVADFFTQCTNYMCYKVERGIITSCNNIPANDQTPERLVELLNALDADTLIVGRIEYSVACMICHSGIEVVAGAVGGSQSVVRAYVSRTLQGISEPCSVDDNLGNIDFVENAPAAL